MIKFLKLFAALCKHIEPRAAAFIRWHTLTSSPRISSSPYGDGAFCVRARYLIFSKFTLPLYSQHILYINIFYLFTNISNSKIWCCKYLNKNEQNMCSAASQQTSSIYIICIQKDDNRVRCLAMIISAIFKYI